MRVVIRTLSTAIPLVFITACVGELADSLPEREGRRDPGGDRTMAGGFDGDGGFAADEAAPNPAADAEAASPAPEGLEPSGASDAAPAAGSAPDAAPEHDAASGQDAGPERDPAPGQGAAPEQDAAPPRADASEADGGRAFQLRVGARCVNPCVFETDAPAHYVVDYEADGWPLGTGVGVGHRLEYRFASLGARQIEAIVYDDAGDEVGRSEASVVVSDAPATCASYGGAAAEQAPIQVAGAELPEEAHALAWRVPTAFTVTWPFAGQPGEPAEHEGLDYVHDDPDVPDPVVSAAARGVVAYVRRDCPEDARFAPNRALRECGAGWGNFVVIAHGGGVYTRYGHLTPGSIEVEVGAPVVAGEPIARMGNSGRSDVRHLHFELGTGTPQDPCAPPQSFDRVYDPAALGL
jgi:murein DD-endopeptidase MepM/ murein hydrolase activator NlpD